MICTIIVDRSVCSDAYSLRPPTRSFTSSPGQEGTKLGDFCHPPAPCQMGLRKMLPTTNDECIAHQGASCHTSVAQPQAPQGAKSGIHTVHVSPLRRRLTKQKRLVLLMCSYRLRHQTCASLTSWHFHARGGTRRRQRWLLCVRL